MLLPYSELLASFSKHPLSNFDYQPGFLRNRNELKRRNVTVLGMLPSNQRLEAADPPALQRYYWLIVDAKLIVRERATQAGLQLRERRVPHVHAFVKQLK